MSDFNSAVPFWVLFVMACGSLTMALVFYSKSRVLRKLSRKLSINVFNKTFNVYDPYPRRGTLNSLLSLMPILALFLAFSVAITVFKTVTSGLPLGLAVFLLCLSPMMIVEAYETYTTANLFIKSVKNRANFGKGDLEVLFLVNLATPRLSIYYVFLTGVFCGFAIGLPYIVPPALLYFAQLFTMPMQSASYIGAAAPYLTVFLFTALFMTAFFVGGRLKSKIFGFPSAIPLTSLEEQFEAVKIMAHWAEAPPFEWSHRTIEEDPVILERKMRELRREEE
jgi:hypothetical protein